MSFKTIKSSSILMHYEGGRVTNLKLQYNCTKKYEKSFWATIVYSSCLSEEETKI